MRPCKDAQIQEVSARFVGGTAFLLNRIRIVSVVGGNEVVNPFNVTDVYVKVDGAWRLGSVSFTRLLTPQWQRSHDTEVIAPAKAELSRIFQDRTEQSFAPSEDPAKESATSH